MLQDLERLGNNRARIPALHLVRAERAERVWAMTVALDRVTADEGGRVGSVSEHSLLFLNSTAPGMKSPFSF